MADNKLKIRAPRRKNLVFHSWRGQTRTSPATTKGPKDYRLTNNVDTEILTWLDDHSRYALSITAHLRVTATDVVTTFRRNCSSHGTPASTLTDNGMVYTTRFAGGRGGRNALETQLVRLRVHQKNSRPNHPTTCGKVERFQQTMKKWLRRQPNQPTTITELQHLLNTFTDHCNNRRPHRSLPNRSTRAVAYTTGEILRTLTLTLTLNPDIDYQPTGKPIGGPNRPYGPRKTKQSEPR